MSRTSEEQITSVLGSSPNIHHSSLVPFAGYVSLETVLLAQFNYWETSEYIYTPHGTLAEVYASQLEGTNIIVIRDVRRQSDGNHTDWYFGTFTGRARGDFADDQERETYNERVQNILKRQNRVAGVDLERLIKDAIKDSV